MLPIVQSLGYLFSIFISFHIWASFVRTLSVDVLFVNFVLFRPEFLDCTARTSLDMLSKHYYQAAGSWVVFFVPENDADMTAYNDFMSYLGDKQRAAVCKLGERSTLFLVPPSDFSEQVLRVPGNVSISGVILKFQQSNPDYSSLNRKSLERAHQSSASNFNTDVSNCASEMWPWR